VSDLGLGIDPHSERRIGLDSVDAAKIEEVCKNLTSNPPVAFDLARKVRVFTTRFQFVEFEMTGCSISRKKVTVPSSLMGLAQDAQAKERLHANFDLIGKSDFSGGAKGSVSEESLRKKKNEIIKRFLIHLPGHGSVVLRSLKADLVTAVDKLKEEIIAFQTAVKDGLDEHIATNREKVIEALIPGILKNPPSHFTKFHGENAPKDILRKLLSDEITAVFGTSGELTQGMKATVVFKDVAYESLVDPKFLEVASKAMPGVDCFHVEFDAAKESGDSQG